MLWRVGVGTNLQFGVVLPQPVSTVVDGMVDLGRPVHLRHAQYHLPETEHDDDRETAAGKMHPSELDWKLKLSEDRLRKKHSPRN